ncbi:hypothetical protein J4E91_007512 [Alternaria rosae]|nr:hypothetical protein J4E91_007512 [Alternaria rosae]
MNPPDQHRRSNVGRGDQAVLHQYAGVDDLALDDNVVDPSILQPRNSRSIQQPATQSTNGGSYTNPAILEGNRSHAWPQQQESMEQEQSCDNGDPTLANYPSASHYHMAIPGATGGWHSHQGCSHEQGGASASMISSQFARPRVPSVKFNGFTNSPMQTPEYYHQADAMADSQMMQDASMTDREHFHYSPMVDPCQLNMGLLHVDPEQPPWSTYQTADMHYSPNFPEEPAVTGWQHTSETTFATTDREGSGSGYMGDSCTPLSSGGYVSGGMLDSTLTERPDTGYLQNTDPEHILPDCPFSFPVPQIDINNDMGPMETRLAMGDSSWYGGDLLVPISRSLSTRSSVSNASSAGPPPTNDPEIMYCEVVDCRQPFTGLYRRGNLGRHRRLVHGTGKPYVCEDRTCAKEFRRPDARLKHYRKYHPELAVDSPLIRRSSASRSMRRNQEVELRNISSWAT